MTEEACLIRQEEAARALGVSSRTLEMWRYKKIGPSYVQISRRAIRYRRSDLEDWIKQKEVPGKRGTYQVWWKRQDEWQLLFASFDPVEAEEHAMNNIVHGHITQRIEVRDIAANSSRLIYSDAFGTVRNV